MAIVTVNNLAKYYKKGNVKALKGVSFEVAEDEIFGIIGPDGAGKTTLFRLLTTLLLPTDGSATIDGLDMVKDFREIRKHIGYMPGKFSLYQDLSVEENLKFFATIFNTTIEENYSLIEDIYKQIEKFKTRKAGKLSGGMKQKLALSCALIHAPRVLFLDEPTTGVDPVSRKEFWEMLQKLKRNYHISIIVSTPYMDEAMQCDRIALIQDGEFMKIDTPENIISSYSESLWEVRSNKMHQLLGDLRTIENIKTVFSFGESYHITTSQGFCPDTLKEELTILGHTQLVVSPAVATIEDCFMALMK